MAEVLLFHHAQRQTSGFHALSDELRQAGHTHYFADPSLSSYDESAATLLPQRVLAFLEDRG